MTFFESMLALVSVAIVLLQVSRRLAIPYPAMLAAAGVLLALVPGAPRIALDPHTALPLFIAPALVDAAFDFPLGTVRKLWRTLVSLAVVAVLLSAAAVAWIGTEFAHLPLYAAIALGAIVAPPDAAAATAILGSVSMPRGSVAVLKGESLLNDAAALLLYAGATSFYDHPSLDGLLWLQIGLAAPGGILAGILLARLFRRWVMPLVSGTLSGNLLEFVTSFGVWVVAERLGLSPVLCLVAFAMTLARSASLFVRPRARIHSFAVWTTTVFMLNVLAFLLMGLQGRRIIEGMSPQRLREALWFAAAVVTTLIVVRMAWVLFYNRLTNRIRILRGNYPPPTLARGVLVGWCGMRGLVTLATAFALPADFPQRDLIVLTAFAVVLVSLIVQGLSLAPLVRVLKLDGEDGLSEELAQVRGELAMAALGSLQGQRGPVAEHWRYGFEMARAASLGTVDPSLIEDKRRLGLAAMRRQRERLEELRAEQRVGADAYLVLQEELDFREVSISSESDRHIEEN